MGPAAAVTSTKEDRISANISRPLISFRMVQYIFEKCAKMPFRGAIDCCSNIPDLKKDILYNLMTMISQWYNKNVYDG